MPLTPFHFGPALFFGVLFFRYIHIPTFLVANVILDLEPFTILLLRLNQPLHGFFHTFLGGFFAALLLYFIVVKLYNPINKIAKYFKIDQTYSKKSIFYSSILGVYAHIIFDMPLYKDIMPFYPFDFNPFYGLFSSTFIYSLCVLLGFLGILLYAHHVIKEKD